MHPRHLWQTWRGQVQPDVIGGDGAIGVIVRACGHDVMGRNDIAGAIIHTGDRLYGGEDGGGHTRGVHGGCGVARCGRDITGGDDATGAIVRAGGHVCDTIDGKGRI